VAATAATTQVRISVSRCKVCPVRQSGPTRRSPNTKVVLLLSASLQFQAANSQAVTVDMQNGRKRPWRPASALLPAHTAIMWHPCRHCCCAPTAHCAPSAVVCRLCQSPPRLSASGPVRWHEAAGGGSAAASGRCHSALVTSGGTCVDVRLLPAHWR
jgi:hypothetical protein